MTNQLPDYAPGPDLRANAFVGAWERIEAAQKLKVDHKKKLVDPLPEIYWATLAEADVLARLATGDEDPGRDAGAYIVDRDQRTSIARDRIREAVNRAASYTMPTKGSRVRVTAGDWTGRTGKVTDVHPDNEPPMVDVALDLQHVTDEPVDICVRVAYIEKAE